MKTLVTAILLLGSAVASAAIPSNTLELSARDARDCKKVCAQVQQRVKGAKRDVSTEYKIWRERLGVKGDTVMYLRGYSAAEELLKFMSAYYVTRAPEGQMDPTFLAYFMGKCFPEAFVDIDHANLSGLVDTVWAAKNLRLAKVVNSCK